MKTFKVTTTSTCVSTYLVDAETQEEAMDNFWDGQFYDEEDINFQNEDIIEVKEITKSNG